MRGSRGATQRPSIRTNVGRFVVEKKPSGSTPSAGAAEKRAVGKLAKRAALEKHAAGGRGEKTGFRKAREARVAKTGRGKGRPLAKSNLFPPPCHPRAPPRRHDMLAHRDNRRRPPRAPPPAER